MLNQKLQQKLQQKLTPQQIQVIKLLEIPTMDLDQRIKTEIEENPALDWDSDSYEDSDAPSEQNAAEDADTSNEKEDFSLEDYFNEDEYSNYSFSTNNYSANQENKEIPFSGASSLRESLIEQIELRGLTEKQVGIAHYIIGNIDDDGYLRREIENIVDDIAFKQNLYVTEDEVLETLFEIHEIDPPGVGARNLQECLKIQIDRKIGFTAALQNAVHIIDELFNEFTKKHYDKIKQKLSITDDQLRDAIAEITKLNPKPGSGFSDAIQNKMQTQVITPDFILEENNGELILSLHSKNLPELKLSKSYIEMFKDFKDSKEREKKEAVTFVKQKLENAKWFIEAIKQRQHTLIGTMQSILDKQFEFFKTGDESKLKPMILKDIAEMTGLDVSTISRVANSKYIQTYFGVYPLKFFFSEGLINDSGEEVSSREIKSILQDVISAEDKSHPLTDDKLTDILKEKGYIIARRTVAKYREQLGIAVGRLRKEI